MLGGIRLYYSKEELERLKKDGEEKAKEMTKKMEFDKIGREYKSNDKQVNCIHCKHTKFQFGKALHNSRGLTFFDLDWLNESAITLICKRCGYIHWFSGKVTEIED